MTSPADKEGAFLARDLKVQINKILHNALSGRKPEYRSEDGGFIRWGLVEKEMHDAVDAAFAASANVPRKLWLWKNFVDGRPEYWAFDNPYPTHGGGDPQTLGEPCGYAIFKESVVAPGRADVPESDVISAIKRVSARSHGGQSGKKWCEHVGGLGPPFPYCEICSAASASARIRFDLTPQQVKQLQNFCFGGETDADAAMPVTIGWLDQHEDGPGWYVWGTEYPDEGSLPLVTHKPDPVEKGAES